MRYILVVIVSFSLLLPACSLDTRDPEAPSNEQITWIPPTDTPLTVLDNLANVIARHENSYDYLLSFSTSFVYVPSEFDQNTFEETFDIPWTLNREDQFCSNLFNALQDNDTVELTFERTEIEDIISDLAETAVLYRRYQLTVPRSRTGFETSSIEGLARFEMLISPEGYWVIQRWEDTKLSDDVPDWGELRNRFK